MRDSDDTERYALTNGSRIEATVSVFRDSEKLLANFLSRLPNERAQADFIRDNEWANAKFPEGQMLVLVEANNTAWHFTGDDIDYDPENHFLTLQGERKMIEAPNCRIFSFYVDKTDQRLGIKAIFDVPSLHAARAPSIAPPPIH